jgi:hypothetical protein
MAGTYNAPSIDEYLRQRLMPVEGAIPHVEGMFNGLDYVRSFTQVGTRQSKREEEAAAV